MSTIDVVLRVQFNDDAYTENIRKESGTYRKGKWHLQKREVPLIEKESGKDLNDRK